jgi:carotenoid cleavage dioxygenase-like enzyme
MTVNPGSTSPLPPSHLSGTNTPVTDEIDAVDLPVSGALPSELAGRYFRNGSNPLPGVDPGHGFIGQGMIHGIRLAAGKAKWYRNRWVKTPTMQGARPINPDGTRNLAASVANTSILPYDGRILALVESALPYAVSPELETVGPFDFAGKLQTPMTAHPKIDPETGELLFFGYAARPPFLTYHVASAEGRLLRSEPIAVTGPTMMHDFAVTKNHVVWLDMPVVFDLELTRKRGLPYRWSDQYPPRLGVMPRAGGSADVRWFTVKPGYAFHVANAHEDARGRVTVQAVTYDVVAFNTIWAGLGGVSTLPDHPAATGPTLYQWQIDLDTGTVSEQAVDDRWIEFPAVNYAYAGRPNRYTYAVNTPALTEKTGGRIIKYDRATGARTEHQLGEGWVPGEAAFVAAKGGRGEDEGWLMTIVSHQTADASQLLVLDATHVDAAPVAAVTLPRRVPAGFHGAWIADPSGN